MRQQKHYFFRRPGTAFYYHFPMNVGTLIASSDNNEIMSHGIYREVLSNILEISSGATKFNIMNFVSMIVLYYTSLIYQKTSKKIEVVVKI